MENQSNKNRRPPRPEVRRRSAGIILVNNQGGTPETLLLRAWTHWDFPKGGVEDGETIMDAAVREVLEEAGISEIAFPWGREFKKTCVYSKDKVAFYSVARTEQRDVVMAPNPSTGLVEHEEFRWIPWPELGNYVSPRLHQVIAWASKKIGQPTPDGILAQDPERGQTKKQWKPRPR